MSKELKLSEATSEKRLEITEIKAGGEIKRQLSIMGLHVHDVLIKESWAKWGPILIKNISNSQSKLALGRTLADLIIVKYCIESL